MDGHEISAVQLDGLPEPGDWLGRCSGPWISRSRVCRKDENCGLQLRSLPRFQESVHSTAVDESVEALQKKFGECSWLECCILNFAVLVEEWSGESRLVQIMLCMWASPCFCSQEESCSVRSEEHAYYACTGISDHVEIVEGTGGLPKVILTHSCGASAEVGEDSAPLSILRFDVSLHFCFILRYVQQQTVPSMPVISNSVLFWLWINCFCRYHARTNYKKGYKLVDMTIDNAVKWIQLIWCPCTHKFCRLPSGKDTQFSSL